MQLVLDGVFSSQCLLTTSQFDRCHGVRTLLSFDCPIWIDQGETIKGIEMYGVPNSLVLWCLKKQGNRYWIAYRTIVASNECFSFRAGAYDAFLELPLHHPFVHSTPCTIDLLTPS